MIVDLFVIRLLRTVVQKARRQGNQRNLKTAPRHSVLDPVAGQREKIRTEALRQRRAAEAREAQTKATNSDRDDEGGWGYSDDGHSPNDDRSDSMNPNNDAYDAAMDNHANQMNPNNEAYHSSRGR